MLISALIAAFAGLSLRAWGVIELPVASEWMVPLILGCAVLFCVGLWDDLWHLSAGVKLIGQTVASLIPMLWGIRFEHVSILGGSSMDLGYWAFPLTFIWVLFITNAWNLIDGLDGLSAGLAVIAAATFAALLFLKGDVQPALVMLVMIGALAGFLWHNFHPATIFLGDSGSLVLGYVLAVTAIVGSSGERAAWPMAIPLLVLGLPILDTALVMTRRLLESLRMIQRDRAEPFLKRLRHVARLLEADQQHLHYRLIAHEFSHQGAVLVLYGVAALLSLLALVTAIAD